MNCRKQNDELVLYFYNELARDVKTNMAKHIEECAECQKKLAELQLVHDTDKQMAPTPPTPDWDQLWRRIDRDVQRHRQPRRVMWLQPRWALSAAALLLVFMAGLWLGGNRMAMRNLAPGSSASMPFQFTVSGYLGSLKTVFADYVNGADNTSPLNDRAVVERLLVNHRLLKQRALQEKDKKLCEFLGDLEVVLLEIAHSNPHDAEQNKQIKELIDKKGIPLKIRLFKTI